MNTELFVQTEANKNIWEQVELMSDETIPLTFNVADIADFTKRNGNYSKTITLPGSKTNNQIFKHIYNLGSYNAFEMNKSFRCYILKDSQEIFNGWFQLKSVKMLDTERIINYEAEVFNDTSEFFNIIKEKYMIDNEDATDDLDFSAYDHTINYTNIYNSFSATAGSGYTYILVDKNNHWEMPYPDDTIFYYDEMTPCLFVKEIFDKIVKGAGFSYTSTFLSGATFSRLIYPHTDRWVEVLDETCEANSSYINTGPVGVTASVIASDYPGGPISATATGSIKGAIETQGTQSCYSAITGYFTCAVPGYYKVKVGMDYAFYLYSPTTGTATGGNFTLDQVIPLYRQWKGSISLCKIEAATGIETVIDTYYSLAQQENTWLQFTNYKCRVYNDRIDDETIDDIILATGDILYIRVDLQLWSQMPLGSDYYWKYEGNNVDMSLILEIGWNGVDTEIWYEMDDRITEGSLMPMSRILHKIKQSDFISSITKMFNLYWELDYNKHFIIEPRDKYYELNTVPIDWTNKVAFDEEIRIDDAANLKVSNLYFKMAEDIDRFNTTYKDAVEDTYGNYSILRENVIEEYKNEIIFAPTPGGDLGVSSRIQIPKIYAINEAGEIQEDKNFKPRILYWIGITNPIDYPNSRWTLKSRKTPASYSFPWWPAASHFDKFYGADTLDLNFGSCMWYWYDMNGTWATWNNLYNLYYADMMSEMTNINTKLVSMRIKLSANDIKNLHFYNLIFIDGIYYHLNKIKDFIPDELTAVELLTVNTQKITFTGKKTRPNYVKPIGYNYVSYLDEFLGLLDANSGQLNDQFQVDLIDPNFKLNDQFQVDVIDPNYNSDELMDVIDKPNLNLDLIDMNAPIANSINEMKSGAKKTVRSVGITRTQRKRQNYRGPTI